MFLKKALLFFACLFAFTLFSQNLIRNASFEEFGSNPRDSLSIQMAKGWASTTETPSYLFYSGANRSEETFFNIQNGEKAYSGNKFTGIAAYSYFAQEPRTYLTNLLTENLRQGDAYCLKMKLMLHPRAKYHTTDLAIVVSKNDIGYSADVLLIDEKAVSVNFPEQFTAGEWMDVHVGFVANEGGDLLNIGNFTSDAVTNAITLPKDQSSVFDGQLPYAYYFIDDLELQRINKVEDCPTYVPDVEILADNKKPAQRNVVKRDDFSRLPPLPKTEKPQPKENLDPEYVGDENLAKAIRDENTIVFSEYSCGLDNKLYNEIDKLLGQFKQGNHKSVTLVARTSYDEAYAAGLNRSLRSLSEKRLRYVKEYLTRKGVSEEKIQTVSEPFDASKLQGGSPTVSFMFN